MKADEPKASVEDLVRAAQAGSSLAFGDLVVRYEAPLRSFLLRRTASAEDAEEVAQDAFVRAWRHIGRYDPRWSFATWLFTLARRLASSHARTSPQQKAAGRGSHALVEVPVQRDPGGDLARSEERANFWAVVDRELDEEARSALWLRYAEDLAIPEIAEVLGRSKVAVRVLLFRARSRLRKVLPPPGGNPLARPPDPTPEWGRAGA